VEHQRGGSSTGDDMGKEAALRELKDKSGQASAFEKAEQIKMEISEEFTQNVPHLFNYKATLDPSIGFATILVNLHPRVANPDIFNKISQIVRDIVITRNQELDEPGYFDGPLHSLCYRIFEFTGGLMVGSRQHILDNVLPAAIEKYLLSLQQ